MRVSQPGCARRQPTRSRRRPTGETGPAAAERGAGTTGHPPSGTDPTGSCEVRLGSVRAEERSERLSGAAECSVSLTLEPTHYFLLHARARAQVYVTKLWFIQEKLNFHGQQGGSCSSLRLFLRFLFRSATN